MGTPSGAFALDERPSLIQALRSVPPRPLAVASLAASTLLLEGPAILTAAQLREASGAAISPTFLANSTTAAAAAQAPALAAQGAGTTNWLTAFQVTGAGATAGSDILVTLTGVVGGPLNYQLVVPAGVTTSITPLIVSFPWPGLPAAAANQAITLNIPSFGAGNTNSAGAIEGYFVPASATQIPGSVVQPLVADIFDGLDAKGEEVLPLSLPLGGAINQNFGGEGPFMRRGIWLNITSGTVKGAVWAKYLDGR